jgi:polyisoprenyl-phosphate glycosyltransferase
LTEEKNSGMQETPILSIVVPAYDEETNIRELHSRLLPVLSAVGCPWELIFVDDGSKDATWARIRELSAEDGRVSGLRFSRNFGHQYALLAGLERARGEAVISMDADLQHPPEVIPELIDNWNRGAQIVNTMRRYPIQVSAVKRWTSKLFYSLFSFLSGVQISEGMADFRLLDRRVVQELVGFREEGLFLRGLVEWIGFEKSIVPYVCAERHSGKSKYGVWKMVRFAWHGISSFSLVPLRVTIGFGLVTAGISFSYLAFALYSKLVSGTVVEGWASTMGVLSFLFGVLFIMLGVVGDYLGKALEQVRARPLFIVADSVGRVADAPEHLVQPTIRRSERRVTSHDY